MASKVLSMSLAFVVGACIYRYQTNAHIISQYKSIFRKTHSSTVNKLLNSQDVSQNKTSKITTENWLLRLKKFTLTETLSNQKEMTET